MLLKIIHQLFYKLDGIIFVTAVHPGYDQSFGCPRAKTVDLQGQSIHRLSYRNWPSLKGMGVRVLVGVWVGLRVLVSVGVIVGKRVCVTVLVKDATNLAVKVAGSITIGVGGMIIA